MLQKVVLDLHNTWQGHMLISITSIICDVLFEVTTWLAATMTMQFCATIRVYLTASSVQTDTHTCRELKVWCGGAEVQQGGRLSHTTTLTTVVTWHDMTWDDITWAGSCCVRSCCDSSAEPWGGTSQGTPTASRLLLRDVSYIAHANKLEMPGRVRRVAHPPQQCFPLGNTSKTKLCMQCLTVLPPSKQL